MSAPHAGRRRLAWVFGGSLAAVAAAVLIRTGGPRGAPSGTPAGPVLEVDRQRMDFGEVAVGEWVEARFVLTNAGDRRLQLSAAPYVRAVAGC